VEGVETGIGAYFDGQAFLRPACLDWEHKRFFPGDVGELTGEMGTLVTYQDSEPLFSATLAKLEPALRAGGYVGYVNLNTIINEQGIWPLELTCRFGYPGYAILDALQPDGWPALFRALRRREGSFRAAPGYAIGVVLSVPPYPYRYGYAEVSRGLPVVLGSGLSAEAQRGLHFSEVERRDGQLVTSGVIGYTVVATGVGATVEEAQREAYALAEQVFVPNLRYRNDIGAGFLAHGRARLQRLGYLP
jgi:phosphoribosylamine--glycine ligase